MVNQEKLRQAEEKLGFAEYLTRPTHTDSYNSAALKHVVNASTLAVQALTDSAVDSPRAMQLALLKFEEPEAKRFAKNLVTMCRREGGADRQAIKLALIDIREFIAWLKSLQ